MCIKLVNSLTNLESNRINTGIYQVIVTAGKRCVGVRRVALTCLPSLRTRAPLLSLVGDGWRYRDRVADLFRPLRIGMTLLSHFWTFSDSV